MYRDQRGFTLIEIVIALTVGAMVILLAHRVFTGVADGARRVTEGRAALDRQMNARRWLTAAFGSLDVGSTGGGFAGYPNSVEFASWQLTSEGWFSCRRVHLARHDRKLVAVTPGDSVVLADSISDFQLDYLLDVGSPRSADVTYGAPGARASFVREWISPVSAPVAIRVRVSRAARVDTLLFIVGPRG